MNDDFDARKYSKISPALKFYFLNNLYLRSMTIKEAASRCKLNYSTAKVVIRDLSHREKKYVKKIQKIKQGCDRKEFAEAKICSFREIQNSQEPRKDQNESTLSPILKPSFNIEIIARIGYDFFSLEQNKNE